MDCLILLRRFRTASFGEVDLVPFSPASLKTVLMADDEESLELEGLSASSPLSSELLLLLLVLPTLLLGLVKLSLLEYGSPNDVLNSVDALGSEARLNGEDSDSTSVCVKELSKSEISLLTTSTLESKGPSSSVVASSSCCTSVSKKAIMRGSSSVDPLV